MLQAIVHLNHGSNKSYLLTFGPGMSADRLRAILHDPDPEKAIQQLMAHSISHVEVPPGRRGCSDARAKFTLSQTGYVVEKLDE